MTVPKIRRRRVRFAIGAVVCLVAGLATTIAIAWLVSAYGDKWTQVSSSQTAWKDPKTEAWLRIARSQTIGESCESAIQITVLEANENSVTYEGPRMWMRWELPIGDRGPGFDPPPESMSRMRYDFGIPLRALGGRIDEEMAGSFRSSYETYGLYIINRSKPVLSDRWSDFTIRLPFQPRFPGLAADTALYAMAWYLLIFTPLALYRAGRRRFRVSRGMCGSCGYDLKGLGGGVCPECASKPGATR